MDAQGLLRRAQRRRKRQWIGIGVVVAIVLILVIAIPCALLLRGHVSPVDPSIVLLPLYIYPDSDAWQPLYAAINATRDVNFTVILNPDSGPGSIGQLGNDYIPAIQRLHAAPNVQTIGYVRTGYTERNIDAVLDDVMTYSNWSTLGSDLAPHGIFFDETPHGYSEQRHDYLATINRAVKDASGIREPKLVIHNPGTIPDNGLEDSRTNVTVVFEHSYQRFQNQQSSLASLPRDRSTYSIMLHSIPNSKNLANVVHDISQTAKYLYVTTADDTYYERFTSSWGDFVSIMGR